MDDKDDERSKIFIEKLKAHISKEEANIKYSVDRFDILIISISSGGLIFSMGFVKDILSVYCVTNFFLLKLSWIFFGTSIMSNLISQVTGFYANKLEIRISNNLIRKENKKPMKGNQSKSEKYRKLLDNLTQILNGCSLLLTISAIILLIIFMSIYLK